MKKAWKLASVLATILILVGGETAAQDSELQNRIILWSPQGPVAVERPRETSPPDGSPPGPEHLVRELLQGPTAEEERRGLRTAIPQGTVLLSVLEQLGETVIVRLDVPPQALQDLDHESFEVMVDQIGATLIGLDWRDLRIQVKHPESGAFVALADFLPSVRVPLKSSPSSQRDGSVSPSASGQPPAPGQGQPRGALSGKTVYVSAGHGWQWVYSYSAGTERWETQRPPYPNPPYGSLPIIEDHNNAEAVNQYLLRYLWNAGAMVWPVRERDMNAAEVIVDNDGPQGGAAYTEIGSWTTGEAGTGYAEGSYRWALTVAGEPTAAVTWRASVPTDDQYAVYVWFRPGTNRSADAHYTVYHAGGATTVEIDQRVHGNTWRYLGTYGFLAGEEARVVLSNRSSVGGKTVVADAVRLGGGTFDDLSGIETGAKVPPDKPWWEVASFYYTQKMGMDAAYGDVTARPIYARWEHARTGDDAVYISWHTNGATGYQWSYSGTETYVHNDEGLPRTEGSLDLRHAIHTEVVHDIRAGWDASWVDRGEKQRNLGELRLLWASDPTRRMPGALIEIGFHDHPEDTDALKEPAFNLLVARAIYQGIVKYFDPNGPLLPESPTHLSVENVAGGAVRVSWQAPPDTQGLGGDPATGYRVYTSTNGIGWSNGVPVAGATDVVLDGFPVGELVFVRVTATNAGGESFPTETLAARVGDSVEMLLVNGFDRLNRTMVVHETDPVEGPNARMLLDRMNRYDYAVQHGEAIVDHAFDAASNEAVGSGQVNLNNYTIVDWILGEESTTERTLDATERLLLEDFLEGDGALFISGSEIGYDLDHQGADPGFYNNVLRADYVGDDAETYNVHGVNGGFSGLGFSFDAPGMYNADYPDQLVPYGSGSQAILAYDGGQGTAGIQYANGCRRVVTFGFPFETIRPHQRGPVMSAVLGFLDECLHPSVDTSIETPTYGSAHRELPSFAGSAHAQHAILGGVEVQVWHTTSDRYWDGSHWVSSETWTEASGTEAWAYSLPASLPEGDYHLRARGRTEGDIRDATPAEAIFTYDRTAPAATALITPTGGITVTALPALTLDWADVPPDDGSAILYRVELDGEHWTTTTGSHTLSRIEDGVHQWRVRVEDQAGNVSDWSQMETFFVDRLHAWLPTVRRASGGEAPECHNVIVNGDFETDAGWIVNPSERPAYSLAQAHSGLRSGIVGYDDSEWSSVRQTVALEGSNATLRLWLFPINENNDSDDWHYVSLWDKDGVRHNLELTTSDAREWRQGEYDLTDFMGQTVTIIVGANNDGDGNLTRAYVDDVELEVCP